MSQANDTPGLPVSQTDFNGDARTLNAGKPGRGLLHLGSQPLAGVPPVVGTGVRPQDRTRFSGDWLARRPRPPVLRCGGEPLPLRGFPRQSVGRLCRLEGTAVPPLESGVSRLRYSEGEAKRYPKGVADWRPRHQNIAALSGVRGFLLLKAKRYGLEINVAWRKM